MMNETNHTPDTTEVARLESLLKEALTADGWQCSCKSLKPCYHTRAWEIRLEHMEQSGDARLVRDAKVIKGELDPSAMTSERMDNSPLLKPMTKATMFRGVEI